MPWTREAEKDIAGALADLLRAQARGDSKAASAAAATARQIMNDPASKED